MATEGEMAVRMKACFAKGCCMAMGVACICSAVSAGDIIVDGRDGAAIQRAIDAAAAAGGGRVTVPAGEYPSGSIRLRSRVDLHLEKGARVVGGTRSEDYFSFPDSICALKPENSTKVFVYAWDEQDISITGEGVIDGQGVAFFPGQEGKTGHFSKPAVERPRMVQLFRCKGIRLEGVEFLNSPCWTMLIRLCENIAVDGVKVHADQRIINSDGIDFDSCRHVRVKNSDFRTGDDCLVMRAMRETGENPKLVCEDVVVTDCTLDSTCQCVRMGCPSDDEIRNITFRNVSMKGRNGIYFDYPARYLRPDDEGYMDIHDIVFENFTGRLSGYPVRVGVEPGVRIRSVRNVLIRNFDVQAVRPMTFVGNVHSKIENVRYDNVTVNGTRLPDGPVAADCTNAGPLKRVDGWSWETYRQQKLGAVKIVVDATKPTGPVKPVNAAGQPPLLGRRDHSLFHYLAEAGIPYSRLHDTGGYQGANVFVDIPNVFRNFDADENDPANYDFAFTDDLLAGLVKHGVEPFYRLGVTIENDAKFKSYRLDPPKDPAKWARICEHVIRHYTEGWANGFRHKMTYWEIWNEPDDFVNANENMMWRGTFEQYMELYEVTARHLKAKFPHLKIGGYGSCGFCGYRVSLDRPGREKPRHMYFYACATNFLAHVRDGKWPLDFFSFHSYGSVESQLREVRLCRETLDRYGFREVPINLDEWLPSQPDHDRAGTALQASEIAAELIGLQKGPCDMAMIYDARCGVGCYSPLFNPLTYKPHKAYYAFVAFNELKKLGATVSTAGDSGKVWSLAAAKDGRVAVMVANFGDTDVPFGLDLGCVPFECILTDETRTAEKMAVPEALPRHSFLLVQGRR